MLPGGTHEGCPAAFITPGRPRTQRSARLRPGAGLAQRDQVGRRYVTQVAVGDREASVPELVTDDVDLHALAQAGREQRSNPAEYASVENGPR